MKGESQQNRAVKKQKPSISPSDRTRCNKVKKIRKAKREKKSDLSGAPSGTGTREEHHGQADSDARRRTGGRRAAAAATGERATPWRGRSLTLSPRVNPTRWHYLLPPGGDEDEGRKSCPRRATCVKDDFPRKNGFFVRRPFAIMSSGEKGLKIGHLTCWLVQWLIGYISLSSCQIFLYLSFTMISAVGCSF
jgi:hypothetical protein